MRSIDYARAVIMLGTLTFVLRSAYSGRSRSNRLLRHSSLQVRQDEVGHKAGVDVAPEKLVVALVQHVEALLDRRAPRQAAAWCPLTEEGREVRVHGVALALVDERVPGGVEDEPADVLAARAERVRGGVHVRVRVAVAERGGDEPLPVRGEGAEEEVEVVDALGEDRGAHGAQEGRRGGELRQGGVEEDRGEDVRGAAVAEEVEPARRGLGRGGAGAGPCGEEVEEAEDVAGVGGVPDGLLRRGEAVVGHGHRQGREAGEGAGERGVVRLVFAAGENEE